MNAPFAMRFPSHFHWGLLLLALSACGGGSSAESAASLQGQAAVGSPVVGASVQAACASGTSATTRTDTAGRFSLALAAADYPCLLQLHGGTISGQWNTDLLHSAALTAGTVTISPFTELALATVLRQLPSAAFAQAGAGLASVLNVATLKEAQMPLRELLVVQSIALPPVADVFTSAFKAEPGDPVDDALSALATLLAGASTPLSEMTRYLGGLRTDNPLLVLGGGNGSIANAAPGPGLVQQYDPGDPDVLLAVPLTTSLSATATVQAVGDKGRAQVELLGRPVMDGTAGVSTGANGAIRFHAIEGLERLATTGWQLYLEVDRSTLALPSSVSAGSSGTGLSQVQYLLSFRQSVSANSPLAYNFALLTDKIPLLAVGQGSSVGSLGIPYNDVVLPAARSHVPVVVWSDGQRVGLIIDGVDSGSVDSDASLGIARVLELGGFDVARVRRLMLVARTPAFVQHPTLKKMAVLGDSYAQFSSDYLHSSTYSASAYLQTLAQLTRAGRRIEWPVSNVNQAFPGHHLMGYASAAGPKTLTEQANSSTENLWDKKEQMLLAHAPDLLLMQVGANDVSADGHLPDIGRWKNWVFEWTCWALGECGYSKSTVKKLAFSTTPWSPDVGADAATRLTRRNKMAAMRDATLAAVQRFTTLYPARTADVVVVDQYAAFGGAATPARYFSPADGADGGAHPSLPGDALKGQTWGAGVLKLLAQP